MPLKTVEQVSDILLKNKLINTPIERKKANAETYGKRTFLYINFGNKKKREKAERTLITEGAKPNHDYWPGSGIAEVQVRYFKVWHWDEQLKQFLTTLNNCGTIKTN